MIIFETSNGDMGYYDYYFFCNKCNKIEIFIKHVTYKELQLILPKLNTKICCNNVNLDNFTNNKPIFNYDTYYCEENYKRFGKIINFSKSQNKDYTYIIDYTRSNLYFDINKIYEL